MFRSRASIAFAPLACFTLLSAPCFAACSSCSRRRLASSLRNPRVRPARHAAHAATCHRSCADADSLHLIACSSWRPTPLHHWSPRTPAPLRHRQPESHSNEPLPLAASPLVLRRRHGSAPSASSCNVLTGGSPLRRPPVVAPLLSETRCAHACFAASRATLATTFALWN